MFIAQLFLFSAMVLSNSFQVEIGSNILDSGRNSIKILEADVILLENKVAEKANKPTLELYYESLCPFCIAFDSTQFKKVVLLLHDYVDIHSFPYGNAKTWWYNDGTVKVECQHGEAECYGNKLHCCSLDIVTNSTEAMLFNACMMPLKSNDASADKCGKQMNIEVDSIKECAKGKKGLDLLVHYGTESEKAKFKYVPYVLLNGVEWKGDDLLKDLCAAFDNPPGPCNAV